MLEKTLMLAKTEGKRREWQRIRLLGSITDLTDNLSKLRKIVDREIWHAALQSVGSQGVRNDLATEQKQPT